MLKSGATELLDTRKMLAGARCHSGLGQGSRGFEEPPPPIWCTTSDFLVKVGGCLIFSMNRANFYLQNYSREEWMLCSSHITAKRFKYLLRKWEQKYVMSKYRRSCICYVQLTNSSRLMGAAGEPKPSPPGRQGLSVASQLSILRFPQYGMANSADSIL